MNKKFIRQELSFVGVILLLFISNGLYLGIKNGILYSYFHGIYVQNEASKSTSLFNSALGEHWEYLNALLNKIDSTRAIHGYTPYIWLVIFIISIIVRLVLNKKTQTIKY